MDLSELLQECGAVQFGEFRLTSGRRSKFYVNLKLAATQPSILNQITTDMAPLVPDGAEVIAGMELGAVPLAVALSLKTGLPYVMIRKGERLHGRYRSYVSNIYNIDCLLSIPINFYWKVTDSLTNHYLQKLK